MREILFRGKRIDNGEWVEGFFYAVTRGAHLNPKENTFEIMTFKKLDNGEIILTEVYDVIPDSVGQYAELNDKNGKKIFEGDIIEDTLGWVSEVRWDNDNGRFLGYHSKPRGNTYICYVSREPKATIIGNIHDNPSLLQPADKRDERGMGEINET